MPIAVQFFTLTRDSSTYAFKPEDISFGDDETLEVRLNRNGDISTIPINKKSATLTLNGAVDVDLGVFQSERDQNIRDMITNAAPVGADMVFSTNYVLYNAYLRNVTPSAPITVEGQVIYETIELEFVSQAYV